MRKFDLFSDGMLVYFDPSNLNVPIGTIKITKDSTISFVEDSGEIKCENLKKYEKDSNKVKNYTFF